jgi:hypothetical protein
MQIVSLGKRFLREEIHPRDAGLQLRNGGGAVAFGLVDRFHRQPHALIVSKGQLPRGDEDSAAVNRLDLLGHCLIAQPEYDDSHGRHNGGLGAIARVASRDGNQGGEMTVAVTEFEGLDPARASVDCIADCAGTGAGESGLAILFPHLIQRLESRRREGIAGAIEPLVEVVAA